MDQAVGRGQRQVGDCATSVIVKERPEPKLRMIATTLLVTLRRGSEPLPATDTLSFVYLRPDIARLRLVVPPVDHHPAPLRC